jgi:hypothetical protein
MSFLETERRINRSSRVHVDKFKSCKRDSRILRSNFEFAPVDDDQALRSSSCYKKKGKFAIERIIMVMRGLAVMEFIDN